MREFSLHVLDAAGKLSEQRVVAVNEQSARDIVTGTGGTVLRVSNASPSINSLLFTRRSHFDLPLFAHELTTLLQAGLSLVEALETLAQRETRRQASGNESRILTQLLSSIRQGLPFSTALSQLPQEFPDLFVATVAATEQTGDLAVGLQRYLRHDEQVSTLRSKIVSAAVYPALLLIVGSAVALFLLIYLVPRFSGIYANIDSDVPLASRLLMEWGGFVAAHLVWVVSGLFASFALLAWWLSQSATRASRKRPATTL
jgi:general secretion pathway protein F